MSNIENAFKGKAKNQKAFIAFLTAGDPSIERTEEFILKIERAGADIIEIGIPFSDPIAEGQVIQKANIRALNAGTTVEKVFSLVARVRQKTAVPLVFLTYLNPVFRYGYEAFFKRCRETGVDGIIIPDLPFEEQNEVKSVSSKYGVDLISLIAPTSEQRIKEIAAAAQGFLYIVSSMGVTGVRSEIKTDLEAIISTAREVSKIPQAVGFGVHSAEQAARIAKIADGVIVGSAIVKIIEENGAASGEKLEDYVRAMKTACTVSR
ncbi:tryptophan synthase alpha chain [Spirochaetia bacterium]|nr:tryptophan synthase alpha chain [Spirochaetia bacterium]